jgi:signal transduction histidine kinase
MATSTYETRTERRRAARLERLLRQQRALRAVVASISSELELRPLLTRIIRRACDLLDASDGVIGLVDEARNVVRSEAVYRMPPDELGAEMPPGVGVAGQVLATRRPIILRRYSDVPTPTQMARLENAVIGVPISWRGRVIGVFGLGRAPRPPADGRLPRPRPFTRGELGTLAAFARHAAIAIVNAREYQSVKRRTERLALIARVGQLITSHVRLDDLLATAADALHDLLGYQNVAIPLLLAEEPEVLVLHAFGGHYRQILRGEYRIPVRTGIMGAAVRERRVQLVNDVQRDPRWIPTPGASGIRAELAVPILLGDKVLGVLNVESPESFDEEDAAGLQVVADQLAVAIENARLYAAAQQVAVMEERNRLARELHDSVTQHLFGITLIAQSLGAAYARERGEGERRVARLLELSHEAFAEMRALLAELRATEAAARGAPPPGSGLTAEWTRIVEAGGDAPASALDRVRRDGLVPALRAHLAGISRDGPECALDADDYAAQPPAVEEALFRVAQEALHNIVKHARARRARVELASGRGGTRLTITDDGVGFDAAGAGRGGPRDGGLGLGSMRERVAAAGGELSIESAPGRGTVVRAAIRRGEAPQP